MLQNYKSSIQPSRKQHVFSRAPKNDAVTYSTFDRSHRHLTTHDADYLIPIYVDEVYPGDIFKMNCRHLSRLLTPIHPFMDRVQMKIFFFYCPNRLVWKHSKEFFGERRRNDEKSLKTEYQVPMLNSGTEGVKEGSIFDYAGIPINVPNLEFSSLPFRAMNLAYNEFFRDENLCDWLPVGGVKGSDGEYDLDSEFGDSDDISNYNLFKIAKKHDYFTSCLPWQQKGEPVSIMISDNQELPVYGNGKDIIFQDTLTSGNPPSGYHYMIHNTSTNNIGVTDSSGQTGMRFPTEPSGYSLGYAKLSGVAGFPISDFRTMLQLQALKELDARCGTRYKEYVKGHFNVTVSDATLDRPEYLGGYTIDLNVIPVASTSGNDIDPQGNLAAFAVTDTNTRHAFSKAFEEHGFVIGFAVCRSEQSYQQGLERFWSRKNKYDFYDPMLANISEQAVKMKEILAQGADVKDSSGEAVDEKTFGYQEAWAELRYKPNYITGKMRSTSTASLDVWHLAPKLEAQKDSETGENLGIPLNQEFIESNTPIDRVIAVTGTEDNPEPQFYTDNYFDLKCTRELPLYSVPAYLTGRF